MSAVLTDRSREQLLTEVPRRSGVVIEVPRRSGVITEVQRRLEVVTELPRRLEVVTEVQRRLEVATESRQGPVGPVGPAGPPGPVGDVAGALLVSNRLSELSTDPQAQVAAQANLGLGTVDPLAYYILAKA